MIPKLNNKKPKYPMFKMDNRLEHLVYKRYVSKHMKSVQHH